MNRSRLGTAIQIWQENCNEDTALEVSSRGFSILFWALAWGVFADANTFQSPANDPLPSRVATTTTVIEVFESGGIVRNPENVLWAAPAISPAFGSGQRLEVGLPTQIRTSPKLFTLVSPPGIPDNSSTIILLGLALLGLGILIRAFLNR